MVRSPAFMGCLSIPWASSVIEQDDCKPKGYLRFEFCDPCMALSQALEGDVELTCPSSSCFLHSFSSLCRGWGIC